ncbi:S-adenosylmethionine decarboxylase [Tuber borchii]|uniref:S-adenosylmethionine decarboxylase n=1 Tax=Tuber borchii TaxID=42251 RepID=A0A2T6ZQA5_TUBBO|nr:S-adenosylmethionine decarboxylase [Tuber borchii]
MVALDLVAANTALNKSQGTTLSINHQATIDLDSSNAFEGPEKLLEVWFTPSPELLPPSASPEGLKCVSKERWEQMLDIVKCKVLSVLKNEHVDAYLLSESSMFVFPHKVILKTCGTTTLLNGLPEMLRIASEEAGFGPGGGVFATPYRVFYSRKSFMFPDKQMHPHKSWRDEVGYLDEWFLNGSAYMVGKMNGEHWYLYLTNPGNTLSPPLTPTNEPADPLERHETETQLITFPDAQDIVYKNIGGGRDGGSGNGIFDETLEVLMTDLDQGKAKQFYLENASAVAAGQYRRRKDEERSKEPVSTEVDMGCDDLPEELTSEGHVLGSIVSEACGLDGVYPRSTYPGAMVDSYLFTPCGFSANAIIPSPDPKIPTTHYFTVHVTPEPHCSYASFETNVPGRQSGRETAEILEHVVGIFRPGRFSVTLFEAKPATVDRGARDNIYDVTAAKRSARMDCIKGYRRVDKIRHDLDGYDLVFRYYERDDWKGGVKPVLRDF